MTLVKWIRVCALALTAAGCAQNPYAEFYHAEDYSQTLARPLPYTGEPRLLGSSGDPAEDELRMYAKGYATIGSATFNAPQTDESEVLQQARLVRASHVIVSSAYESTVTGAYTMMTPTTNTGTYSGMVGATPYSGSVTTTGTQTTSVPYSVNRYDQSAVFFAPLSRAGFGVYVGEVPTELRPKLGTNAGIYVLAVREDSPAYRADVVPGDVLLAIDGQPLTESSYAGLVKAAIGKPVELAIWRLGERLSKTVTIAAAW